MGILNITPDSFSDGGQFFSEKNALIQVEKMIVEGALFIDIGAQSTRPQSQKVTAETEIHRLGKIIAEIRKNFPQVLISLDTFYADVVQFGYNEGIDLVNDISAGQYDPNMHTIVAKTGLPYIVMHSNPSYETIHEKIIEDDIVLALNKFFSKKIAALQNLGIQDLLIDPGFGFGKTGAQQHQLIEELSYLMFGQFPILAGISRKSFIFKPLGKSPLEISKETQLLHLQLLKNGAHILRVHDVAATQKTIDIFLTSEKCR